MFSPTVIFTNVFGTISPSSSYNVPVMFTCNPTNIDSLLFIVILVILGITVTSEVFIELV